MIDVPIQVKDALREGRLRKNYRFQVLNNDGTVDFTIDNNNLVSESVNIDERMCSGDKIKYGLCEGSSLEFQYFGKENITGRQLKVFLDVEYGEIAPYAIPMGYFDVKNCSRQASTGIMKATAYNKLMSDYLESDVTEDVKEIINGGEPGRASGVSNYYLLNKLLEGYEIDNRPPTEDNLAYSGREGNSEIGYGVYDGISDLHDERIVFLLTLQHNSQVEDKGFFVMQRKLVVGSMNEVDADYKVTAKHTLPQGYHTITINPNIASEIRNGITSFFAQFQDDEMSDDYYYVQPVYMSDGGAIYNRGESIRLKTLLESIDSDTEILYPAISSLSWSAGNLSHLDNAFKGMIGWYYGNRTLRTDDHFRLEKEYDTSLEYNHYNFLTPKNRNESDIFFISNVSPNLSDVVNLIVPSAIYYCSSYNDFYNHYENLERVYDFPWYQNGYDFQLKSYFREDISDIENFIMTSTIAENLPNVTLRELQSAVFETECQFGKLDRETDLFSGVELNNSRLLPADTLYPDNALYPSGAQESAFRSQYSKLWADEGNVRKWRYLIITYKGLDENEQEKDFTLQRTVNADGTDDYNCSNNWLFRNLIWTAADIGSYADAMVLKMRDITWFPFEMWCAGLPYLETGDEIEIPLGEDTYTSYILQRQLKGIQNLQDTYINGTLDIF